MADGGRDVSLEAPCFEEDLDMGRRVCGGWLASSSETTSRHKVAGKDWEHSCSALSSASQEGKFSRLVECYVKIKKKYVGLK